MEEKYFSDYGRSRSELLVECGFITKSAREKYDYNKEKNAFLLKQPLNDGSIVDYKDAEEEESEWSHPGGKYARTGYPKPMKSYWLTYEAYDLSLEEPYFWVLEGFKQSFPIVDKIEDSFAASENSAFFGVTQQRLAAQQTEDDDHHYHRKRGLGENAPDFIQVDLQRRLTGLDGLK